MDASEAYDEYLKAYESSKKEGNSGKLGGGYGWGFISGEGEFAHSYDRKLSEEEFSKKFNKNKAERQKNSSSSSAKDASLISVYQSSVRDATSVKAWEHCMSTRYPEPGLFAYGYRDASGNPYIVVMWQPGTFAAVNPVISVKFGMTEPGMTIDGVTGPIDVAGGTGAAYSIRFAETNGAGAESNGFVVLVNGELKSGNQLVQSFRSEAVVPRHVGPIPCSVIFAAGKSFTVGVFDTINEVVNWNTGLGFSMLSRAEHRPSKLPGPFIPPPPGGNGRSRGSFGPPATNTYNARLSVAGPATADEGLVQVNLAGTTFEVTDPDGPAALITGGCTGQGVLGARLHTPGPGADADLEISIRAR